MLADPSLTISSIGVIVGLDLVGDALIKLPFVRALRGAFPDATIHWITAQGPTAFNGPLRDLTKHLIDNIFEQPSWLPTKQNPKISDIDPPRFDILIDTRGKWREAWRARTSMPSKIFISPAARFVFSDRGKAFFQKRPPHLADKLVQLVELAGGSFSATEERLPVPELLLLKARQMMPKGYAYFGLAPGAGNPVKIWPRDNFINVAHYQISQGRVPVFLLGPQEESWLPELREAVPESLFPLQARKVWGTPDITVAQTLAVGSLLSGAVCNDSGTGHMLAAIGCPLVSLFGPTSPEKLAPRVSHGIVVRAQDFAGKTMDAIPSIAVQKATDRLISL